MRVRTGQWAAIIGVAVVLTLGGPGVVPVVAQGLRVSPPQPNPVVVRQATSVLQFAPSPASETGATREFALVGDTDGDGIPDLIAFRNYGGTGQVLHGRGDGTFVPVGAPIAVAPFRDQAALADMNGDGRADLVTARDEATVRPARADGTFPDAPYGDAPILVHDVNRDGRLDVVFIAGGQIRVSLGNGDGTLKPPTPVLPVWPYARLIAVADQTGDGMLDLIIADAPVTRPTRYLIKVCVGDGAGGFVLSGAGETALSGSASGAADFNRDGVSDLLVSGRVYLGRRDGSFRDAGVAPAASLIGDLDDDGLPDLVGAEGEATVVWRGRGDGGFEAAVPIYEGTGLGYYPLAVADMNRDGRSDIVLLVAQVRIVTLLNQPAHPNPQAQQRAAVPSPATAPSASPVARAIPAPEPPARRAGATTGSPLPLPPRR